MTTVQQTVDATLLKLHTGRRPILNQLTNDIDAVTPNATLDYETQGIGLGGRISIGLEDMHIWSVTNTDLVLRRGMGGSTAAAHLAGSLAYVNTQFSPFEIFSAVNELLALLPGVGVQQFKTVDLTYNSNRIGYDLSSVGDVLRVHRVSYRALGGQLRWVPIPRNLWSVAQNSELSDFPSAEALTLYGDVDQGATVRVLYQAPFSPITALTDDVAVVTGLPVEAHNLLPIGAAYRLLLGTPVARAAFDSQGDARRPSEATTGDARSAMLPLFQEWSTALKAVKMEQTRKYRL